MSATAAAASEIGLHGTFSLRGLGVDGDGQTLEHSFTFKPNSAPSDAAVNSAAAAASSSSTVPTATTPSSASEPARPQRVTANTSASHPSAIPRTCPTDSTLAELVKLINQAKEESDRFLTEQITLQRQKEGESGGAPAGKGKKRTADEDEEEEADDGMEEKQAHPAGKKQKSHAQKATQ